MQKNSTLAAAIINVITSIRSSAVVNYIKGVPGGGKTFTMAYLALAFMTVPEVHVLWTSAGNAAISEGAQLLQQHIDLSPPDSSLRKAIARIQGFNQAKSFSLDIPADQRNQFSKNHTAFYTGSAIVYSNFIKAKFLCEDSMWA